MLPTPESAAPPPAGSLAGWLLNIFAAPGDVFNEVKAVGTSNANWLLPAILLVLASWVSAALVFSQPAIRQQISEQADKALDRLVEKGNMPGDRAEKVRPSMEKMAVTVGVISAVAGAPVVAFALPFWWGLILWLGGKVYKGNFSYLKAVEVAGLANMILVLDAVVRTLLILVTGNLFTSPSLVLVVKDYDPQNILHGLCALVNVMLFWALMVRSIGLARLSGASIGKAALWVFGIWAAYTGTLIGLGAAFQAIMSHMSH